MAAMMRRAFAFRKQRRAAHEKTNNRLAGLPMGALSSGSGACGAITEMCRAQWNRSDDQHSARDRHRYLNKRSEFSCSSAGTFLIMCCFIFAQLRRIG
jgi:hypothetical protein